MGLKLPPSGLLGNTCCHLVSLWWTNPPTHFLTRGSTGTPVYDFGHIKWELSNINTKVEGSLVKLLTEKVNNSK